MEDTSFHRYNHQSSCSIALTKPTEEKKSCQQTTCQYKTDLLTATNTEPLSQALEKQFRSLPTNLCDKIEQAEHIIQQLNTGKTYMSCNQLQQNKTILSECQEEITSHLSQQAANTLTQPVRIYATQTTTDLTLLKKFLGIIISMITGIDLNLEITTALNQAGLAMFLESQKDKSLQEIGTNVCSLYAAQKHDDEQRKALQVEVKMLKSGIKAVLAIAKICSGGITPDSVYEVIYNTTEFVKACNELCERNKSSNNQKTNSFIQDAVAKAAEIRQKEEAISELSKTIELLDLKITAGTQLYLQSLAAEAANLDSKSLQDLIQLRNVVYQVGITANNLAGQLCQTCEDMHIDLNQHEQYNASLNLVAIFDKSKETFDRINQVAEMRNQKLPDLPELQKLDNLTTTSPLVDCNAVLQKVDKLAGNLQGKTIPELWALQQQVSDIGLNANDHLSAIKQACEKDHQEVRTSTRAEFIDKMGCIYAKYKGVYDQIDGLLKSSPVTTYTGNITIDTTQTVPEPVQRKPSADEIARSLEQKYYQHKDLPSKIEYIHQLLGQSNSKSTETSQEMIDGIEQALQKVMPKLKNELSLLLNTRPAWLKDDWWSWPFGKRPAEKAWNNAQQAKADVLKFLNLDGDEPMFRGRRISNAEVLAQASNAFQELDSQANGIADFGLDLLDTSKSIDANRKDFAAFNNEIKNTLKITQTGFDYIQASSDARPAAQFIKTSSTPQWIDKKLWENYVESSRAFVLDHYGRVAHVDDDVNLGHLLVNVCLLQQQLPDENHGSIDADNTHELIPVRDELKFVGGVLNQWLTDQRRSLGYPSPQISSQELSDIARTMAFEERDKQRAAFYNQSIPDQIAGIFVQAGEFYAQAAIQQYANIGLSTDLQGKVNGNIGPFTQTLRMPNIDDGSDMIRLFAETYKRCSNASIQDTQQPGRAAASQQAAPSASAQPVTQQATLAAAADVHTIQQDGQPAPSATTVQQQKKAAQTASRRQEIIRNAARLLAQHKLNPQQQPDALTQAYQPLEPFIMMADSGKPFEQQEVLFDLVQTVTSAHNASIEAANHGDVQQAETWAGIRDALGQLGAISWHLSGLDTFGQSWSDKQLIAAATGAAKGATDFAQGAQQLLMQPKETIQQLEWTLNRLDHFAGQLYRNNPEAKAKVSAAIQAYWECHLEQKVESAFRIFVSFGIAPHALNKRVGVAVQAVQDTGLLDNVGTIAKKIGTGAVELAQDTIEGKTAVTPEGIKIPVGRDGEFVAEQEFVANMKGEAPRAGKKVGKDGLPLDRREMTPEQIEAEAVRKAQGEAIRRVGKEFEEQLQKKLGGIGEFEVTSEKYCCTRQFDGAYGNVYYEAKAGGFWAELEKSPKSLNKFQSQTIQKLNIAKDLGKDFEIHTNSPIPQKIKEWFIEKGISFHEWL